MGEYSVADEVVGFFNLDVPDWLAAGVFDGDDPVPENGILRGRIKRRYVGGDALLDNIGRLCYTTDEMPTKIRKIYA